MFEATEKTETDLHFIMANNLSLPHIINYANLTFNSRNLKEAERFQNSVFIITFRATEKSVTELHILAMYLKTRSMKDPLHTINSSCMTEV